MAAAEASLAAAVAGFPSEAALTATIEQLNERLRLVTLELGRAQKEAAEREDDLDRLSTEVNILRTEYSAQRVRHGGCCGRDRACPRCLQLQRLLPIALR